MEDYHNIVSSIRDIANGVQPQINISELLLKHGCTYLVSKCLSPKIIDAYLCFNKAIVNERYKICAPLFRFLDENNIKYVVMKGAVLSNAAYGNFAIRKSADIDLFVNSTDVDLIKKFILDLGFVQGRVTSKGVTPFNREELIFYAAHSHQIAPFVKTVNTPMVKYVNLDINTSLLWGESPQRIDAEFALSHREEVEIGCVQTKKFVREFEFVALCLHHYKDMNSIYLLYNGSLKLSLFCDIYYYIMNNTIDFLHVKEICEKYQIGGFVYYCIYYTNEIFGGMEDYLDFFFDVDMHNNINKFGLDKDRQKVWDCSFYQRLFRNDFNEYFCALLDKHDVLKIRHNKLHI